MTYLIIVLMLLYCIVTYDLRKTRHNSKAWYYFLMICFVLVSGFGYRLGGDGLIYLQEYSMYRTSDGFSWGALNAYPNRLPGWVLLIKMCKIVSSNYVVFKLIHSFVVNVCFFISIKRYSSFKFTTVLFYFILFYFDFNFQILRQSIAVGVFLLSLPAFEKNDWGKYYLLNLIALSFHDGIILCMLLPFVKMFKLCRITIWVYSCAILLFILFSNTFLMQIVSIYLSGDAIDRAHGYITELTASEGFSSYSNLLLSIVIPYFFIYKRMGKNLRSQDKHLPLKYHLVLLYGFFYTIGLFIPIFYRFNHFFILFFYMFYIEIICEAAQWLSSKFQKKNSNLINLNGSVNDLNICKRKHYGLYSFFAICAISIFLLVKSRFYFLNYGDTNYPVYVQYYPYSSVFFENKDDTREKFYRVL